MDKYQSLPGETDDPGNTCLYIMRTALLRGAGPNEAVFTPSCKSSRHIWLGYLSQLLQLSFDHLDSER